MIKIGTRIHIIHMDGENAYNGRSGIVTFIDSAGQLHGTWGGLAINPDADKIEVENEV